MEERDPAALRQRFIQSLNHVDEPGGLRPDDLQLPIFVSPQYYKQLLPGGVFDPETLGAASIVVPQSEGRAGNSPCTFNLSQVPTLSSLSS